MGDALVASVFSAQEAHVTAAFPTEPEHVPADGQIHRTIQCRIKDKETTEKKDKQASAGLMGQIMQAQQEAAKAAAAAAAAGSSGMSAGSSGSGSGVAPPPKRRKGGGTKQTTREGSPQGSAANSGGLKRDLVLRQWSSAHSVF